LKSGNMYNLVLLVPDDLPPGIAKQSGNVEEMRQLFKDWDPVYTVPYSRYEIEQLTYQFEVSPNS
jgi:hypothetical protein